MEQLRVLIAEDNDDVRVTIFGLLCGRFNVIGAVCDAKELFQSALCLLPDVIISEIHLPLMEGLAPQKLARVENSTPWVFVTDESKETIRVLARERRAGFVHKAEMPEYLCDAVESVFTGLPYFSPRYR
jgi:DNA-binding NarL/FixJ family response regulator